MELLSVDDSLRAAGVDDDAVAGLGEAAQHGGAAGREAAVHADVAGLKDRIRNVKLCITAYCVRVLYCTVRVL